MEIALADELYKSIDLNLSFIEVIILLLLIYVACRLKHKIPWSIVAYNTFLILYITLLRRSSGYNETNFIRIHFRMNAIVLVGDFLNLFLYMPFGWSVAIWKTEKAEKLWVWIIFFGFMLSVFCEGMQFLTGRGMADINDVLFNTFGTGVGVWLSRHIIK